ncbi:GNAT family N-acetyltransferase [Bacillus cereus group sp. MYBK29-1]|uniref:GNAT family N-acetyltransferase n=1 Tax=Bacillus cereus group TaxID=86661 RepID=UPI0013D56C36|nr:GNAT family N-acetyltransferase [Bacillus tropicus]
MKEKTKMTIISIEKAKILDAEKLTEIMTRTFDEEAKRWLCGQGDVIDYNIQPPGYSSVEMMRYSIEELDSFKVMLDGKIIGGIIVTISGKSYGRIDRIFVEPVYQGKGIGSNVIKLIEEEYPSIRIWDLETSSRQLTNHHFYKKMGYEIIFKSDDEYCYVKRITVESAEENLIKNNQYENCNLANTEYYQVNLKNSAFVGSNIMHMNMSNCNVSQSKFRNINFKRSLFADLNLSGSKFNLVTLGGVQFKNTSLGDEKESILFDNCDLEGTVIHNSNLKNIEIENCDITGMEINGIPIEKLLALYNKVKS